MTVLIGQTQYSVAARAALQRHRSIRDHFAAELFAEPALEALLQLFIAQEEGVRLSMLTLAGSAACPNRPACAGSRGWRRWAIASGLPIIRTIGVRGS